MTSWANKTCMHDLVAYMSAFDRQSNLIYMYICDNWPSLFDKIFSVCYSIARIVINMTWWTLFLWSTKKDFWFLYMKKKNNLKIKILFFGTQETFINNFFLSGLSSWKICWLLDVYFLKLFFFSNKSFVYSILLSGLFGQLN